jgi:hypothetical protein
MDTCQKCGAALPPRPPGKRGPKPKYCTDCAKASTAESKRKHKKVEREVELTEREKAIREIRHECCRRYARESTRHALTCPRHRPISTDAGVITPVETSEISGSHSGPVPICHGRRSLLRTVRSAVETPY